MSDVINLGDILSYRLVKFTKRIVFDIISQRPDTIWTGDDDGNYYMYIAKNDVQIISRSRMDIQTERLWLMGAKNDSHADRSGTMVFATREMCDKAYPKFHIALAEWAKAVEERGMDNMPRVADYRPKPPVAYRVNLKQDGAYIGLFQDKLQANEFGRGWGEEYIITPLYE